MENASSRSDEAAKLNKSNTTNKRSNPAFTTTTTTTTTVSHITTSAEITHHHTLRSVSIPESLLIKKQKIFTSMSTHEDDTHASQLPPPLPTIEKKNKKKSFFINNTGDECSISNPVSDTVISRTPPHSNTPLFLPRYANSPPAGSGGKYMMKSKRTSWIVDAGVITNNESTMNMSTSIPTTPISFPETIKSSTPRSRKTSVIDSTATTTSDTNLHYNKSGSISKLRENRLPSPKLFDSTSNHHRNSSISSVLTDSISAISSDGFDSSNDDDYSSFSNMKCTCFFFLFKFYYLYILYCS